MRDTESEYRDKVGLDFGCGCGRNVQNLWWRFKRMDGVDLSFGNLVHAHENLVSVGCPPDRYRLFQANGVDLGNLASDEYDFVMSTIVMQHIAVYDIRFQYLMEFFRVLRPGGLLSFQMGYGEGYGKAGYYDNHYDAESTNSFHDTTVTSPDADRRRPRADRLRRLLVRDPPVVRRRPPELDLREGVQAERRRRDRRAPRRRVAVAPRGA